MAYIPPKDRVRETATDAGTADFNLAATTDFLRFSAICANGDTVDYAAILGSDWEVGVGTWATGSVLQRTTIKASSNGGAKVSFSAGTKDIFNDAGAHVLNALLRFDIAQTLNSFQKSQALANLGGVGYEVSQTLSASMQALARGNISSALKNHIFNLVCANNATDGTNDIDIGSGEAASTENNPVLMVLASALTKQLDATWAPGNNAGGRESGDTLGNKTYHVWLIQRSDTGVVDALFSSSATSPTMPTNYDRRRLVWSIVRASGAIIPFTQRGDDAVWKNPRNDFSDVPTTSTVLRVLTVPTGVSVKAKFAAWYFCSGSASASGQVYFSSPLDAADVTATGVLFSLAGLIVVSSFSASGMFEVSTDTSGQIRSNANYSDGSTGLRLVTLGFTHSRGRV